MKQFTIHNVTTGQKVSEFTPRQGKPITWPDGAQAFKPRHGLERITEDGHWRLYANESVSVGEGPNETESDSEFDALADRYVVTITRTGISPASLRSALLAAINPRRAEKIGAGIAVTVGGNSYVLQTDAPSRENIDRAALGVALGILPLNSDGSVNPAGSGTHISWRMRDNTDVLMDGATFLSAIAVPLGMHVNGCHLASRYHKEAIEQADDAALVDYDLADGWPAVAPAE